VWLVWVEVGHRAAHLVVLLSLPARQLSWCVMSSAAQASSTRRCWACIPHLQHPAHGSAATGLVDCTAAWQVCACTAHFVLNAQSRLSCVAAYSDIGELLLRLAGCLFCLRRWQRWGVLFVCQLHAAAAKLQPNAVNVVAKC
jgi:hypothetical protein